MKMKKRFIPFLLLLLFSCTNKGSKSKDIETVYVKPITITDSVMTSFPGNLLIAGNYLVWSDPFNYSAFIKVVDIHTGKQVAQTGVIGQGPKEFVTPSVKLLSTDKIGVTDLNRNKRAELDIEKLINGQDPFTYYRKGGLKGATRYIELEHNKFVGLYPKEQLLFKFIDNTSAYSFGHFPIDDRLETIDRANYFQGNLAYNPDKKKLIYCPFDFPYIMTYKKSGDSFTADMTLKIFDMKYKLINGKITFKDRMVLISEMAITESYIVAARPKKFKNDIDINTGMQRGPHTLYLYDYDLNLQKIVDIKAPILRLAGNEKSNTVYAIIMNPEYSIVKIELPEMDK